MDFNSWVNDPKNPTRFDDNSDASLHTPTTMRVTSDCSAAPTTSITEAGGSTQLTLTTLNSALAQRQEQPSLDPYLIPRFQFSPYDRDKVTMQPRAFVAKPEESSSSSNNKKVYAPLKPALATYEEQEVRELQKKKLEIEMREKSRRENERQDSKTLRYVPFCYDIRSYMREPEYIAVPSAVQTREMKDRDLLIYGDVSTADVVESSLTTVASVFAPLPKTRIVAYDDGDPFFFEVHKIPPPLEDAAGFSPPSSPAANSDDDEQTAHSVDPPSAPIDFGDVDVFSVPPHRIVAITHDRCTMYVCNLNALRDGWRKRVLRGQAPAARGLITIIHGIYAATVCGDRLFLLDVTGGDAMSDGTSINSRSSSFVGEEEKYTWLDKKIYDFQPLAISWQHTVIDDAHLYVRSQCEHAIISIGRNFIQVPVAISGSRLRSQPDEESLQAMPHCHGLAIQVQVAAGRHQARLVQQTHSWVYKYQPKARKFLPLVRLECSAPNLVPLSNGHCYAFAQDPPGSRHLRVCYRLDNPSAGAEKDTSTVHDRERKATSQQHYTLMMLSPGTASSKASRGQADEEYGQDGEYGSAIRQRGDDQRSFGNFGAPLETSQGAANASSLMRSTERSRRRVSGVGLNNGDSSGSPLLLAAAAYSSASTFQAELQGTTATDLRKSSDITIEMELGEDVAIVAPATNNCVIVLAKDMESCIRVEIDRWNTIKRYLDAENEDPRYVM